MVKPQAEVCIKKFTLFSSWSPVPTWPSLHRPPPPPPPPPPPLSSLWFIWRWYFSLNSKLPPWVTYFSRCPPHMWDIHVNKCYLFFLAISLVPGAPARNLEKWRKTFSYPAGPKSWNSFHLDVLCDIFFLSLGSEITYFELTLTMIHHPVIRLWKLEVVIYWESLEKSTNSCEYNISSSHSSEKRIF